MDATCTTHHVALCDRLSLNKESSYPATRQGFIDAVRNMAHGVDDAADAEKVKNDITDLCTLFFDYCTAWHEYLGKAGKAKGAVAKDHEEAGRLKTEAGAVTRGLQKVATQFACCDGLLHAVMKALDEDIKQASSRTAEENKDINWTYDLPEQVALMTKKRNVLSDYMVRVRAAKPIVEKLELAFLALEKLFSVLLGPEEAKKLMAEYTGLLRKHLYNDADKYVSDRAQKDLKRLICFDRKDRQKKWNLVSEIREIVTLCVKSREKYLTGRGGRVFLRQWEVDLAYDSMIKELDHARQFLDKYEVPEIRYRRDALDRQAGSLNRLTTIEDILSLYEDLLKGRFMPMVTLKDVRGFEEDTLKKVTYMTHTISKEIEHVEEAVFKLAQGPDPESVPDDKLFEGVEEIPALAAAE